MSDNKTKPTNADVQDYIARIEPEAKREEALVLLKMCEEVTGEPAKMWGSSLVGCGSYHYKYESGREGDMFLTGFAFRKPRFVAYVIGNIPDQQDYLDRIGKYKMGKSCLYFNKLADIDQSVLRELYEKSVAATVEKYGRQ